MVYLRKSRKRGNLLKNLPVQTRPFNIGEAIVRLRKIVYNFADLAVESTVKRVAKNPFVVLFTTILSLRTRDAVTIKIAPKLFEKARNAKELTKLTETEIEKLIKGVGFYRNKAKTIKSISQILIKKYGGKVPDSLDELLLLPGVGRKTANLVLIEGFNKMGICVDSHVHQVSNRWGYVKTKSPDETEFVLRKKLTKKYWKNYNNLLVRFGQNICVPISPKCTICPLTDMCPKVGVKTFR